MPYRVTFALDIFRGDANRELSRKSLDVMLKCLFELDVLYLQSHPKAPGIYQSGVRYMEEPPGQEEWQDIPTCLAMGTADCEDLAAWRAAELTVRHGIQARPFFQEQRRPDGSYLYHILVRVPPTAQHPRGAVEDPSRILGMR